MIYYRITELNYVDGFLGLNPLTNLYFFYFVLE